MLADAGVLKSGVYPLGALRRVREIAEAARWHIGTSESDAVADALFQIADAASRGEMPAFMQG